MRAALSSPLSYVHKVTVVLRVMQDACELLCSKRLQILRGDCSGQHVMILTGDYRHIIESVLEDEIRILGLEDHHGN